MIELTKKELKIIMNEFMGASNRVLRANYAIYGQELGKYVNFLESHELIYEYIKSCGEPEYDVEKEVAKVCNSFGHLIFTLGSSNECEVANIYAVIKYLADNNISGCNNVFFGYSSSKKFQEKVNGFGNEFIRILVLHIENYLIKLSIQMGMDEQMNLNMNINDSMIENAQINVASSEASMVINNYKIDEEKLKSLIENLLISSKTLSSEDKQTVDECIETIETIKDTKPKKGIIKTALKTLKGIVGTTEFMAAVTSIVFFIEQYL